MDTLSRTLNNPVTELVEGATEVIETSATAMGELITSSGVNSLSQTHNVTTNQTMPLHTDSSADDMLSCSMEVSTAEDNISKLVQISSGTWDVNRNNYTVLTWHDVPHDFKRDNTYPAYGQFSYFRYSRCGYSFRLTVTPSQGNQGCLVISFFPPGTREMVPGIGQNSWQCDTRTLLSAPYALLDVRTSTEVALTVPYVNNRNYVNHTSVPASSRAAHGGVVVVWQLSKLQNSTTSANVGWSLYGELLELDLQCPRFFGNGKKFGRRKKVVPPKKPPVQKHVQIAPGPGAVNMSNGLATAVSESVALVGESTSIDYTTAGSCASFTDLREAGRRWAIMYTNSWQTSQASKEIITQFNLTFADMGHVGLIAQSFEYWRGSIEIKIMVFGSTLTTGRYQFCWYPEITTSPSFDQCRNSIYVVSDVGAAPCTLIIPFVSTTWRRSTQDLVGRCVMFVVNKLSANISAPGNVEVVILARFGKDFQLFCPRSSGKSLRNLGNSTEEQMDEEPVYFINYEIEQIPIQSESHSLIRNYFSRQVYFDLAQISASDESIIQVRSVVEGTFQLMRLFCYWSGELVFTVSNESTAPVYVMHTYEDYGKLGLDEMTSRGAILIPGSSAKSFNAPFYSKLPLRCLHEKHNQDRIGDYRQPSFGYLHFYCHSTTTVLVFFGFRNPNFFFQIPLTIQDTARTLGWIRDLTNDGDVESNPGPSRRKGHNKKIVERCAPRPQRWVEDYYEQMDENALLRNWMYDTLQSQDYKELFYKNQGPNMVDWEPKLVRKLRNHTPLEECGDVEMNPGPKPGQGLRDTKVVDVSWSPFGVKRVIRESRNEGPFFITTESIFKNCFLHKHEREEKRVMKKANGIPSEPVHHQVVDIKKNIWSIKTHTRVKVPKGDGFEHVFVYSKQTPLSGKNINVCSVWVPDLTICGDVESNPGPWDKDIKNYVVIGLPKSGKSRVANIIAGKKGDPFGRSQEQKEVTFGDYRVTDTGALPRIDDMVDCFVYVHNPKLNQKEEQMYVETLDTHLPNWHAHSILVLNFDGATEGEMEEYITSNKFFQKLLHRVANRMCAPSDVRKMAEDCLTGPYFSHFAQLVYLDRGLYRHYGVRVGESVFHLNTDDILKSSLQGTARVQETSYHQDKWKAVDEVAYRSATHFVESGAVDLKFNIDSNCDSWARQLIGSANTHQGSRLKWCLSTAAAAAFIYAGMSMDNHSPGMFSKLITSISSHFYGNLENIILKTVIRTVCRIICYLILYCHSPNLLTTGVIVALIAMDLTSVSIDGKAKAACEALANGEFAEFCSTVIDLTDDPDYVNLRASIPNFTGHARTLTSLQKEAIAKEYEKQKAGMGGIPIRHPLHTDSCRCVKCIPPYEHREFDRCECKFCLERFGPMSERNSDGTMKNQGKPKSFNEWTTCAKNIQWWIEGVIKCFDWLRNKLFPPNIEQDLREIEAQASEIALIMAACDEHIVKCRTEKAYVMEKDTRKKHQVLVDKMTGLLSRELPAQLSHFGTKLNTLMQRLQSLSLEPALNYSHRPEPLGIWIQGEPGSGKSFLANYLVKEIAQRYGWNAYAHPIGSDHMDGYTDQEIHVFDDLGQNRDEEDMALMCNLVSSVPFIVPKADLTSKGTTYNGRVVIVTTNKTDFSSIKLSESKALQRRFPIVLHVRPSQEYERQDSHGQVRFNAVNATMDGSLSKGACWDRNVGGPKSLSSYTECWVKLKPDVLLKELYDELDSRDAVSRFMNQGKVGDLKLDSDEVDEFDKFFPDPNLAKAGRIKNFIMSSIEAVRSFVDRHKTWFIAAGALGTVVSLATILIPMVRKWFKKKDDDESDEQGFYGGRLCPTKIKNFKVPMSNQGPVNMKPILRSLVNVTDETGEVTTALAVGGKTVVTYGHDKFSKCCHIGEESVEFNLSEPVSIRINDEGMDLVQYDVIMPVQFKSSNHKIHDKDYRGDGYLLWKERNGYSYLPVTNIHPTTTLVTSEGTSTSQTYTYIAKTWKGSCGAVLVGIVDGNPKILGIHIAGNKNMGAAARLYPMFNQGKVTEKIKNCKPYFQPRKTKYEESPVHSGGETVGPAVLSRNDPRLEIEVDDITKKAAEKYIGNHFDPPPNVFALAKAVVTNKLKLVVRQSTCMTFEEAISSDVLPIDWQTSAGHKYPGCSKQLLVKDPKFKDDVHEILRGGPTYFTTYLKDELRSKEKIAQGNTRAIEASNFDYVVAWRIVMGNIAKQLYGDQDRVTGFAPGINVYTHWDSLMDQVKFSVCALDFKKFDGSLSPELMRQAVDVLASFHVTPDLVRMIHEPTVNSYNLVSDEIWIVNGGMCSGSPATTVLNTVCNLLVNYTVALSFGIQPDDIYIAGYGDDTIFSVDLMNQPLPDTREMQVRYKEYFGMNVTSATKEDLITWTTKNNTEFLKRRTGLFPRTCKVIGVLDLQSMMDHIGWTKGNFQEQLDSFYMELVLHGEDIYNKVRDKLERRSPSFNHPSFDTMWLIMKPIVLLY